MKKIEQVQAYYLYNENEAPLVLHSLSNEPVSEFSNEEVIVGFRDVALEKGSSILNKNYDKDSDCIIYSVVSKDNLTCQLHIDKNFLESKNGVMIQEMLDTVKHRNDEIHGDRLLNEVRAILISIGLLTVLTGVGYTAIKIFEKLIQIDNKKFEQEFEEIENSYEYQNYKKIQDRKLQIEQINEYKKKEKEEQEKELEKYNIQLNFNNEDQPVVMVKTKK